MQVPSHRALQHITIQAGGATHPLWTRLPLELRRMILQSLANVLNAEERLIAIYASVSREWQEFFEPMLWQKLTFRPWIPKSNFQGLREAIQSHRRYLIKTISLNLQMEEYRCSQCLEEVGGQHTLIERERVLFENLEELLFILALWTQNIPKSGIALELRGIKVANAGDRKLAARRGRGRCAHRRSPAIITDVSTEIAGINNVISQQGPVGRAPCITAIFINKSISWSCSSILLCHLCESFPNLQRLTFEQQLGMTQTFQQAKGNKAAFFIACRITSLQKLSIWETRTTLISEAQSQSDSKKANRRAGVLMAAVFTSFHVKELAITHVVDARNFISRFNFCMSSDVAFPPCKLERLVLSCKLGRLLVSHTEVDRLLLAASQAAKHMPVLKLMEIWSPGVGEGFLFRYEVTESEINLTVAATWQFDIVSWQSGSGYKTLRAWEKVASRHADQRFNCAIKSIEAVTLPKPYSISRDLESSTFIRDWSSVREMPI